MAQEIVGRSDEKPPEGALDEHLHDRIKMVAYELWEQEGRPEGRAMDHWDEATRRVLAEARGGSLPRQPPEERAPVERVTPNPRKEVPGVSADTGGTPSPLDFNDVGRA